MIIRKHELTLRRIDDRDIIVLTNFVGGVVLTWFSLPVMSQSSLVDETPWNGTYTTKFLLENLSLNR